MSLRSRYQYLLRISQAYLGGGTSQLSFWHETPELNPNARGGELGEYYMTFRQKAEYAGPFDENQIPLLDYRGVLGPQYNPIAIAQYALGNFNLYARSGDAERRKKFLRIADWLVEHLEKDSQGLATWRHHFDWEYRVGPRYNVVNKGRFQLYAVGLFGGAHFTSKVPYPGRSSPIVQKDWYGFTWAVGGGAEYHFTNHWGIRGQWDHTRVPWGTELTDASDWDRITGGVTWRW